MPNIATLLKTEITRLANKAVRTQLAPLQSSHRASRRQIAQLRKQVASLEKQLAQLRRGAGRTQAPAAASAAEGDARGNRFVAKGFRSLRARLGLSAAEMATLLGVSGQSVYKWELGKARPRAAQIAAIAALRGIGKREARARLAAKQ